MGIRLVRNVMKRFVWRSRKVVASVDLGHFDFSELDGAWDDVLEPGREGLNNSTVGRPIEVSDLLRNRRGREAFNVDVIVARRDHFGDLCERILILSPARFDRKGDSRQLSIKLWPPGNPQGR